MRRIVFCDFDGTITVEETFVAVLKKFAPQLSAKLLPEMYARRVTLRQGVRTILESIPSSRYSEILEFTQIQPIRKGFVELLDFLEFQGVPLVVVSGGLRGMVETVLDKLVQRVHAIHAVDVETSGNFLKVNSQYERGTELIAKVEVMAKYPAYQKIAIGDSLTDLNMALEVNLVFARDRLAEYLDEHQKSYIPWNDFSQIRDYLVKLWK
ncbi:MULTISPECIES: HAD-IB family phosphatase [unclassified Tolypothrix]|uniref:HAD-IB family phosphatase n=1 Tax=unclassified Tolypothrix TaxID=2649714 RepID=UPI0005F8782C|nr:MULTISPECIES: HAD-IB family phosphatase [unclassified Tolypothrix]MBE9085874.1 HAD-IB family phosphatase [Tolypothrix sp. LEGE 11397]UYD28842.1 HAD-IB family phosphatase [Tolypothrix sp. PCC 7712]UYD35247.1 HAD-IB family phosphatase [Tolypothrix sp. PCC 7601]BAY88137.1 HAD-superfamily hydrolase [Microchaete diplosiphon NIES-3275]